MTARAAAGTGRAPRAVPRALRVERQRRQIVDLVLVVYVLSLVEGPLRKWFLPGLATPLYFLRDPVLIVLYAYAFRHGFMLRGSLARVWLGFAAITTVVGLIPFIIYGIDLRAWILGARSYWVYLPMAFVVANAFRRADLERFIRWNVGLAVPYAMLVVYQYKSPAGAWINKSIGEDSEAVALALGLHRPNGLFTFTGQNVGFTAFLIANYVAFLFLARWRRGSELLLLAVGVPAVASLAVLTGSRAIYFQAAVILLVTLVGSTMARPSRAVMTRNGLVLALVIIAALMFTTTYQDMYRAMELRVDRAEQAEGPIWERALGGVTGFAGPLAQDAPLLGYGIGTGTPAVSRFLKSRHLRYGEGDLMRSTNELGYFLGFFFIALRWFTAGLVVWLAYLVARRGYPVALPLAGYAAVQIAVGAITHSPMNAFVPWLVVGLMLTEKWQHLRKV